MRHVPRDANPSSDSTRPTIPAEMTEQQILHQVKLFIEMADYNPMDGHLVVGHFRSVHGKAWTLRILEAILRELQEPSIELNLSEPREAFLPFYEELLERHRQWER